MVLAIQNELVNLLEDERIATDTRYGVKDVTRTDITQSEACFACGVLSLYQCNDAVEMLRFTFMLAAGLISRELGYLSPLLTAFLVKNVDNALVLRENNSDLHAAKKAAGANVEMAESGLIPDLSILASAFYTDLTNYIGSQASGSTVKMALNLPIYNGSVASAHIHIAKHTFGQCPLTTEYHTEFPEYIRARFCESLSISYRLVKMFKQN